jgi:hypothetical protein
MLTKNDFSETDWNALRETPHLVGAAVMMAGSSGLGTLKESFAIAKSVLEGQSSELPLLRDLSNRDEIMKTQEGLRTLVGQIEPAKLQTQVRSQAIEKAKAAVALLSARGTAEEASAFRTWIYKVAESVAKSAKEGGFLGIGGTQVSEGEQAFLGELKSALGL